MPRPAKVRWDANAKAWRSDVGPYSPTTGRRKPKYFREIPETAKGKRQAEDELAAHLYKRDREESVAVLSIDNPPVWKVVDDYVNHAEFIVSPNTHTTHCERLDYWMGYAPGAIKDSEGNWRDYRLARSLTPGDLSRVLKDMAKQGRSAHYIVGVASSVKACWAWAARLDEDRTPPRILAEDVFRDIKGPRIPDAPERYIPPEQAEALLRYIEGRAEGLPGRHGEFERMTALMYRVQYQSGARPGELCRVTWRDFDPAVGVFILHKHKTAGKTGRPRRVPLPTELAKRVAELKNRDGAHPEYIFTHRVDKLARGQDETAIARAGEPWKVNPLGQKFLRLRRKSGLDIHVRDGTGQVVAVNPECTLYDFRRTFSTDAEGAGFTDQQVADAQGNSAEMQSRIYRTKHAASAVLVAEAVADKRRSQLKPQG